MTQLNITRILDSMWPRNVCILYEAASSVMFTKEKMTLRDKERKKEEEENKKGLQRRERGPESSNIEPEVVSSNFLFNCFLTVSQCRPMYKIKIHKINRATEI